MFLKKLKIGLPYDPVIPLLGIYPEKTINVQKDAYTPIFIAVLFTIAKTWNIYTEYIYTYIYICIYNKILLRHKKNKIRPFAAI